MFTTPFAFMTAPAGGYDPDAQAYINAVIAAGGTLSSPNQDAINTLYVDLKTAGIYSKLNVFWPFTGGISASMRIEGKLQASYYLTFSSGWTFSSSGVLGNGINTYAETNYAGNLLDVNDSHLSLYQNVEYTPGVSIDFGSFDEVLFTGTFIACEIVPGLRRVRMFSNPMDSSSSVSTGFLIVKTNGTNSSFIIDGSTVSTIAASGSTTPLTLSIGSLNTGAYNYSSPGQYAFASAGKFLDSTETTNFSNIIQAFQTSLGR
jgi:hypothetical protein